MTKLDQIKFLFMVGRWYRKQSLDFSWDYYYVKSVGEQFGFPCVTGHHININQSSS